jgi:hypothetical protein
VFERASLKLLPVANRAAEVTPMTTACCNACRTCATTNLLGIVFAAGAYVAAPFMRLTRRAKSSQ